MNRSRQIHCPSCGKYKIRRYTQEDVTITIQDDGSLLDELCNGWSDTEYQCSECDHFITPLEMGKQWKHTIHYAPKAKDVEA